MAADNHYFAEQPASPSARRTIAVQTRGIDLSLTTDRGTFSPDRLDPGTEFLLERAPEPPASGRFLDLGCGYGPIALTLASLSPAAEVVAVDSNERARQLCRDNATANGCDNVTVFSPDECETLIALQARPTAAGASPDECEAFIKQQGRPAAAGAVDLIWSNPPIRIGKAALHTLLLGWLGLLAPEGEAVLVVNRHLGADSLQRWLTSEGFATERLASRRGYRLLHCGPT